MLFSKQLLLSLNLTAVSLRVLLLSFRLEFFYRPCTFGTACLFRIRPFSHMSYMHMLFLRDHFSVLFHAFRVLI